MSSRRQKKGSNSNSTSYASTVIGITLVLFTLGCLGLVLINANSITKQIKENIQLQIFLEDDANTDDVGILKQWLAKQSYVKSAQYISKTTAANEMESELGEDFINYLGHNPLPESFNVFLTDGYAQIDSIKQIEEEILTINKVESLHYNPDLIDLVNKNVKKITFVLLGLSLLLLLVSVALINNTIRLAIFSKRFLIRTMKLVGATHSFIRRPFIMNSIYQGILSATLAFMMIIGLLFFLKRELPELFAMQELQSFMILFALIVILGIVISYLATYFAVRKYIRLKTDDLY